MSENPTGDQVAIDPSDDARAIEARRVARKGIRKMRRKIKRDGADSDLRDFVAAVIHAHGGMR